MKYKLIVSMLAIVFLINLAFAASITQTVPTSATPNSQFQIQYKVNDAPSDWGAIVVQDYTGGCKAADGSTRSKYVMLSLSGISGSITVTAPSSGTCTITGYYTFADASQVNFPTKTVTISTTCTPNCACASTTCTTTTCSNGCGGTCPGTKSCTTCEPDWNMGEWSTCSGGTQTRTVTDLNNCGVNTDKPETSQSCSTTCTPNCDDKECGTNGCGGSCGSCEEGFKCSSGECKEEINIFEEYWWAFLIGGFILLLVVLKK